MALMKAGDAVQARTLLEDAVLSHPDETSLWLNIAGSCRVLGDLAAAFNALEQALRVEPRSFLALLMKASLLERSGSLRQAGIGYGIAIAQAPPPDQLDPPTRRAFDHARAFHDQYSSDLRDRLAAATAGARGLSRSPESRRIEAFIDHVAGRRRPYYQRPMSFFYPGLPAIEFYPREDFPWMDAVEAATPSIQRELMAVTQASQTGQGFTPYVDYPQGVPLDQWAELNHSPRWNAYHLLAHGGLVPGNSEQCPRTLQALSLAPQPQVRQRSPAAMFSVLAPRTRIPPHTGVSNTRLVVHLPLIVPPGCGFRVGNETREWRPGEAWVFDDTIAHEAWNDSHRPRTILIFDIWSPFLGADERALISLVTAETDAFNGVGPADSL